jgi:hypothetical protein
VQSHTLVAAAHAAAANNDGLTWWLASACMLAFLLATAGAILLAVHQRRDRIPETHYRRHPPTGTPGPPD